MIDENNIKKSVESILFLAGEPITVKKLASLLSVKTEDIKKITEELRDEFSERGLRLIEHNEAWQMATAPEISSNLEKFIKSEYSQNLSRAAMEVLAIVAYKGPLTRAEVEFIRGVNSVYSLRNLLMRGLIEKKENPADGRSHIYAVTFDFLRHFGMENINKLPRYEEFHKAETPKMDNNAENNSLTA